MLQTKAPLITRADYEGMPEGPPYFQVIEGDLVMSPSPKFFHQTIAGNIFRLIGNYLENNPIGEVAIAPFDVFLSDINVYQPDVMFVAAERESIITERGIEGAPNLVVEVLSPTTEAYDKGSKRKVYARCGVEELWLVDPVAAKIEVYLLQKDATHPAAIHSAQSTFTSQLLPGLQIEAQKIFKRAARRS